MTEFIAGVAEIFLKFGATPLLLGYLAYNQWEIKKKLVKTETKLERYMTEDRKKGFEVLAQNTRVVEQNKHALNQCTKAIELNNRILENLIVMK